MVEVFKEVHLVTASKNGVETETMFLGRAWVGNEVRSGNNLLFLDMPSNYEGPIMRIVPD